MIVFMSQELDYDKELAEARDEKYGYPDQHECGIGFPDYETAIL